MAGRITFRNYRRPEDNQSREMIWAFTMANALAQLSRDSKPENMGRIAERCGQLADAAVAEYDKRCEYEEPAGGFHVQEKT